MNLLPPFFKYARRIDKSNVIELIYKRLGSVDDYGNGFVGNTFKTILESEINLKSKIVDDFALNLKPNPLDYTLGTHTMKLKTDYLLLVTKLYGYLDHWGILEKEVEKVSKIPASQKITEKVIPQAVCSLMISIECANNIKNPWNDSQPPNTYISFTSPFETEDVELRTPVVYHTTFPQWEYEYCIKNINMNLLCNSLVTKELELQVFHKKISDGKYLTQESILIGTLFIDASALVQNPSRTSLTGYYHIFKNPRDKEINDYSYTHSVTMGQAKVTLEVDRPLVPQAGNEEYKNVPVFTMNEVLQDRDFERENIDDVSEEEADGLKRAMRKAQELRKRRMDEERKVAGSRVGRHMSPVTDRIQEYDENLDSNLHNASIQELKVKNMQNFKELDDLTTRLKTTFLMKKDDLDDVDNNDDLARATGQSANFELDM